MFTALDMPSESLEEAERSFLTNVRQHGWFDTAVFSDAEGPGFSFTTGLWINTGQPELIIFGLSREIAHDVFWSLFHDLKAGLPLPVGTLTDRAFAHSAAYILPVAKRFYPKYLGWSQWFYRGKDFPCLQIVWPDRSGLFPWEPGFDQALSTQQVDLSERGWQKMLAT